MSLKYERRLLEHLKHERYTPANVETVAHDLGVAEEESGEDRKSTRLNSSHG